MKKIIIHAGLLWLPLSAAIVIVYGVMYLLVQQDIRQSANDILVQYAADAKDKLSAGMSATTVVTAMPAVNMQIGLAPFVILYDMNGKPIAGSGKLHGQLPAPPTGVFDHVAEYGEHRLSWQPELSARSAIVVMHGMVDRKSGFILAGRSLREIEIRERSVLGLAKTGLVATLIVTFLATVAAGLLKGKLLMLQR